MMQRHCQKEENLYEILLNSSGKNFGPGFS